MNSVNKSEGALISLDSSTNRKIIRCRHRQCDTCFTIKCVPRDASTTGSTHGVSAGAVAGAVIASVVFLAAVTLAFLWYRRRLRLRRIATAEDPTPDVPARAEDVLNRPDPNEKPTVPPPIPEEQEMNTVRIYTGASQTTINLDPEARGESLAGTQGHNPVRASVQSNPFTDTHSIQSASTGTQSNVIPIALVPPGSVSSMRSSVPSTQATSGTNPTRPVRSPDLDLNLDHANVSNDSVPIGNKYAQSAISGITNRNSYMTTGSYSSDFLNEAPIIVTPTTRTVKQVVGLVKAEVVRTPPGTLSSAYSSEDGGTPRTASSATARPPARSPLAGGSFGPSELMHNITEEHDEQEQEVALRGNPFGDEHSPYVTDTASSAARTSPAPTSATFGDSVENWDPQGPRLPWAKKSSSSRPDSYMTQAGSIISADIGTASRVHLGLDQLSPNTMPGRALGLPPSGDLPHTPISAALSTPRSPYRMTSAKLVAPPTTDEMPTLPSPNSGALERQQRRAFEELDARMSRSSVVSSTSTRADSILEGFPFVPPSPISDRPIRTPPRSPLAQHAPASPPLPAPPSRKMLGMSTASQSSTMSSGLGSFPFQIDSGNGPVAADGAGASPPSSFLGRQRASLDTLALTSDLSSYPLGFDKTAMDNYPGPRRT